MKRALKVGAVAFALCAAQAATVLAGEAKPAPVGEAAPAVTAVPKKTPDTLMFTIDEFNDIQSHMSRDESSSGGFSAIENASLYLSTIIYAGPNDWTIWVNGVPIGPHQEFQAFKVTDISPASVQLLVPLSAEGMRPVRLSPNQTFIARSGVVIEGRVQ